MAYDISDFSIGQRVRIREWDDMKEEFGLNVTRYLLWGRARKEWEDADGQRISVPELTGRDWHYSADMLEPVEEVPTKIQYDEEMFLDMIGVAHR